MNDLYARFNAAPASSALLATIVIASVFALTVAPAWLERQLLRPYWLVRRGEYATLLTSGFLHADFAHLFFNAFTFWAFAFALEREIGSTRLLALYFFGLLAGDAGTWLRYRHNPDYRCLGASGAILAVLFAAIVYTPGGAIYLLPLPVPIPAPLFAFGYLAYTLWASRQARGRVNHDAHFAGALAGLAFVAATDQAAVLRALHRLLG